MILGTFTRAKMLVKSEVSASNASKYAPAKFCDGSSGAASRPSRTGDGSGNNAGSARMVHARNHGMRLERSMKGDYISNNSEGSGLCG